MKDLIRLSGIPRKTIHYYISEGLLPAPLRSGRNSAVYGRAHLDRLQEIRVLREMELLPVKAIKAYYNGDAEGALPEGQRRAVQALRSRLPASIRPGAEEYVSYEEIVGDQLSRGELKELQDEGLVNVTGRGPDRRLTREDAVVLQSWIRFKQLGYDAEAGYSPKMLCLWRDAIAALTALEIAQFEHATVRATPEDTATAISEFQSIVNPLIEALHYKESRTLFDQRLEQLQRETRKTS